MSELLRFENVSKRYKIDFGSRSLALKLTRLKEVRSREVEAVHDLSFSVSPGEVVCLMGHNGAGKSTALRIAAGVTRPSSGRVARSGRIAAMLGASVAFHPELSGVENIFLNALVRGMTIGEVRERIDAIVEFAGLGDFIHAPLQTYSTGMAMRLGFSITAHSDFDLLIIDEALSVGDASFRGKCLGFITDKKAEGKGALIATHSRGHAQKLGSRTYVMREGRVVREYGPGELPDPF